MNPPLNTAFACLVFQTSFQYNCLLPFRRFGLLTVNILFNGAGQFKAKREDTGKVRRAHQVHVQGT